MESYEHGDPALEQGRPSAEEVIVVPPPPKQGRPPKVTKKEKELTESQKRLLMTTAEPKKKQIDEEIEEARQLTNKIALGLGIAVASGFLYWWFRPRAAPVTAPVAEAASLPASVSVNTSTGQTFIPK